MEPQRSTLLGPAWLISAASLAACLPVHAAPLPPSLPVAKPAAPVSESLTVAVVLSKPPPGGATSETPAASIDPAAEAIRQAILTALEAAPNLHLLTLSPDRSYASIDAALAAAKAAGANRVIIVTHQTENTQDLATAAIYLPTGKSLGVAAGKAPLGDPFTLQDTLSRQVCAVLLPDWRPPALPAAAATPLTLPASATATSPSDPAANPSANLSAKPLLPPAAANPVAGIDLTGVTPVPFSGSALARALEGTDDAENDPNAPSSNPGLSTNRHVYVAPLNRGSGSMIPLRGTNRYEPVANGRPGSGSLPPPTESVPEPSTSAGVNQRFSRTGSPYSAGGPAAGHR